MSVRRWTVYDTVHSFEHNFFVRLSQSFPLLKILSLQNTTEQEKKRSYQSNQHEQRFLVVKYPHLTAISTSTVYILIMLNNF
jgi:hypothetical protein